MAEKPLEAERRSVKNKKRSFSKKKKASSESPHASPVLERQPSGKGGKKDEVRCCYIPRCVDKQEVAASNIHILQSYLCQCLVHAKWYTNLCAAPV